jgi:NiFe hydrogenase small subunit HydA
LLNTIYYTTIDKLLVNTLDMEYNTTVMAGAGPNAISAANTALGKGGYILVVEGAVPTGASGRYCTLWPGLTAYTGVRNFAAKAAYVIAAGTCAAYGGMSAGSPNPTGARSVQAVIGSSKKVVNIPGCPTHPDWLVGTIAYILSNKRVPTLDSSGRPSGFFSRTVHSRCPYRNNSPIPPSANHGGGAACTTCHGSNAPTGASALSQAGCLYPLGCKGPLTYADCPTRKWNSAAAQTAGVNWCVGARVPCHGCTEKTFPDGMSPFFRLGAAAGGGTTASCSQCHSDGMSGSLPANHPAISGGTGGTTTTVNCSQCHSDGSTAGTLPAGHPRITVSTSGGTTTRRREEEDDD